MDGRRTDAARFRAMPEIRLHTLADIGAAHSVTAYCEHCRHSRELNIPWLIAVYGGELTIAGLKARLTCHHCRERSRSIRISHDGTPG
jgi:hypothetical protein